MKKLSSRFISYFLQGIIVVVPVVAVFLTGKYLYDTLSAYRIFDSVGLTLLIVISGILVVGVLGRTVILRPIFYLFEDLFTRAPIIKFVYSSIKDLMEAFVGEKKRFTKPVMMNLIEETSLQRFGFVTEESLDRLGNAFTGKVAVYVPMSYSLSGNLYIVPATLLTPLPHVDSAELMKFIVSGGVTELEEVTKGKLPKSKQVTENPEGKTTVLP